MFIEALFSVCVVNIYDIIMTVPFNPKKYIQRTLYMSRLWAAMFTCWNSDDRWYSCPGYPYRIIFGWRNTKIYVQVYIILQFVNSPHKVTVMRREIPCYDVILLTPLCVIRSKMTTLAASWNQSSIDPKNLKIIAAAIFKEPGKMAESRR